MIAASRQPWCWCDAATVPSLSIALQYQLRKQAELLFGRLNDTPQSCRLNQLWVAPTVIDWTGCFAHCLPLLTTGASTCERNSARRFPKAIPPEIIAFKLFQAQQSCLRGPSLWSRHEGSLERGCERATALGVSKSRESVGGISHNYWASPVPVFAV